MLTKDDAGRATAAYIAIEKIDSALLRLFLAQKADGALISTKLTIVDVDQMKPSSDGVVCSVDNFNEPERAEWLAMTLHFERVRLERRRAEWAAGLTRKGFEPPAIPVPDDKRTQEAK